MIDVLMRNKYMFDPLLSLQISKQAQRSAVDRNLIVYKIRRQILNVADWDARWKEFYFHNS